MSERDPSLAGVDASLDTARFIALPQPPPGDARWEEYQFELARSLDIAHVLLSACGVTEPPGLGVEFPSPLPLPGDGQARLIRGKQESTILLVDERLRRHPAWDRHCDTITVAEAYASCVRGKLMPMSGSTLSVWARRAYRDTGILDAEQVRLPPLPSDEAERVRRCHETVKDVLTVRWMREIAPAPLAHEFLNGWSGQGERQIGMAMKRLLGLGIMNPVGEHQPAGRRSMALFNPGPCPYHSLELLWRKPACNPRWQCASCESPVLPGNLDVWTPRHGIIKTTQANYRRAETAHGQRVRNAAIAA